jgi:predicted DNA-binding transcriptional regulator YafY
MRQTGLPKHIVLKASGQTPTIDSHLGALHQAIMNYQKVELVYNAVHSDDESMRKIDPHYLFFHDGFWYLRGYCHTSKGMRTFALDRMKTLKTLSDHFLPKAISPEDELATAFGTWLDGEPTEIVLQFDKEIKQQILRKKWHQSQTEKELKNGKIEMRFTVKGLGGIKKWIYQWIPYMKVIAPSSLKREMKQDIERMKAKL